MRNLVPLLLILAVTACSNKGTDSGISNQQIMPLAVGNSWTYVDLPAPGFTGDTNTYTLDVTKDTVMTVTINSVNDIGHWFKITNQVGAVSTYFANRSDGHWQTFFYNDGINNLIITLLMAKYPTTVGDIYSRLYPAPLQNASQNVEVISTDSLITVPAGAFTCHVYRVTLISGDRLVYDAFYSVGVGLIKTHVYELTPADNRITRETRLTAYSVK